MNQQNHPLVVALTEEIEAHWSCAEGPSRAWFKVGEDQHLYHVFGYIAHGRGLELEQELCKRLLDDLKSLNRGGLLLFRRRPELGFDSDTGSTKITVRLAFFGGEDLKAPQEVPSFKEDAALVPRLRPLLEEASWLRGSLYAVVQSVGGDVSVSLDTIGRILKPEAQLSYEYEGETLRLRTR